MVPKKTSRSQKKRNKDTELSAWNEYIKPIIKEHKLFWKGKLIEYEFFPVTLDSEGMYLMQSKMMRLCLGIDFSKTIIREKKGPEPGEELTRKGRKKYQKLFEGPDEIMKNVTDKLRGAKRGDKRTQILIDIFREFLIEILEDKMLPYFLELLDREDTTKTKTKKNHSAKTRKTKLNARKSQKKHGVTTRCLISYI